MPQPQHDIGARISVVDAQGKPFGGAIDLVFQPQGTHAAESP